MEKYKIIKRMNDIESECDIEYEIEIVIKKEGDIERM